MTAAFQPADDYLHPITDHPDHNESAYYNFSVPGGMTGWARVGNRVNDGHAEVTVCLYLPDDRIAFWWDRAEIRDPLVHDAGGLRFDVLEPFSQHRVRYDGEVAIFDGYRALEDPKAAFAGAPRSRATIELEFRRASLPWGGGHNVDVLENFAGAHFEQHMTTSGTVTVGDEAFCLDGGLGLRDHSWGPRRWQQVAWYRWLTVGFTPELGVACTIIGDASGAYITQGYVHRGPEAPMAQIVDAKAVTSYAEGWYPQSVEWTIRTADGNVHQLTAAVRSPLPLRHRRDGQTTRIIEGPTTYTWNGREAPGMTEYLDLMIDGTPVGATYA